MQRTTPSIAWLLATALCCAAPSATAPTLTLRDPPEPRRPLPTPTDGKRAVSGTVYDVQHYCGGGARATDEQMQAAYRKTPRAASYQVAVGEQLTLEPPVASFTTGADGRFALRLEPGTYCVYASGRSPPPPRAEPPGPRPLPGSSYVDERCLEDLKRKCDAILKVADVDVSDADIELWQQCSEQFNQPCWIGPMPP